ncbi:hypothetical protein GJ688_18715 [Heliobacillus mobilis]|uniref:Uncharacterized protein n=1 Tax=Heliobacterium mobile TaxID=28064 RepID=A0A6I3SRF2_HELMO|nr:hypothetical protein [Heliobacterium mobile]MTV50952.1 hypothetical protein [Heliobacterium mobile]
MVELRTISRYRLTIWVTALLIFFGLLGTYKDTILQEGNPIPVGFAIFRLTLLGEDVVRFSEQPERFIVKNIGKDPDKPFFEVMKLRGWEFKEQFGSAYTFLRGDRPELAIGRMFTQYFSVFELVEQK